MKRLAGLLLLVLAGAAGAEAPERSIRPEARVLPEPITRTGPEARPDWFMVDISPQAPWRSARPNARGPGIMALASRMREERRRGSVCGDLAIQGRVVGNVPGAGRCGVEDAVRVTSVSGIVLSRPATIDCTTARALRAWVDRGLKPAVGNAGGGPEEMRVMAHYACRGRNNVAGARLSEHSFGRAIDIGGIRLRNGTEISVLQDWNTRADGRRLRQMHRAACGIFGTVLGPEANAAHRDHFHFDTARYRSGSYCR